MKTRPKFFGSDLNTDLIPVIFDLKLDGPNLNNPQFEGLCRSEAFTMAPTERHASILSVASQK